MRGRVYLAESARVHNAGFREIGRARKIVACPPRRIAVPVIMSKMRPATAKILCHSEGMGSPNVGLIRTRAEELARINGHAIYTEADWQQAKHELHGTNHVEDDLSEEMGIATMVSGADMVA